MALLPAPIEPVSSAGDVAVAVCSIVQVEARHAATIGLLTKQSVVPNGGFDKPLTKQQVLAKAGPLIKG